MSPELPEVLRVLFQVVDALDQLAIPYHLGGSFASSIHGIPRQTQDIDLVVELGSDDAGRLVARVGDEFYGDASRARKAVESGGSFNLIHLASGVKIDLFILGSSDFDREEFSRREPTRLGDAPVRETFVKSAEDTILRKLLWFRQGGETSDRQWGDITGVVKTQGQRLDLEYLRRWATELSLEDLLDRALQAL
jgi:hypothetical protein